MKNPFNTIRNATTAMLLAVSLPLGVWGAPVSATGGDEVYDIQDGDIPYRVHVFTNTGPATLTFSNGGFVDCLIVGGGGGGGGGAMGGGGGGGGVLYTAAYTVDAGDYTATVGTGGLGGFAYNLSNQDGVHGGDSSFDGGLVAVGGGGGSGWTGHPSTSGGSGGGGNSAMAASPGTPGQGYAGAIGSSTANQRSGGGGGGAGAPGSLGVAGAGGKGGDGRAIFGSYYGGGGGGGLEGTPLNVSAGGAGGLGGGGAGSRGSTNAVDAKPNTGGGGGGAGYTAASSGRLGGAGGSGIVIIRYVSGPVTPVADVTLADAVTGSERFTNTNGVKIAAFPVHEGYDRFQCTGESNSLMDLDAEGWLSTNAIPEYYATFIRPATDTNVTLYVWFTNTTDTAKPLLRSAGQIYYTSVAPVPVVRPTLKREQLPEVNVIINAADIDIRSSAGVANGVNMTLYARKAVAINIENDLTPDEPYVTLGATGTYLLQLWLQNEAGNAITSVATCRVSVASYNGTNTWTGAGLTNLWIENVNWSAGVPLAGQNVAITGATDAVTIDAASASLASFTLNGGTVTFYGWNTLLDAQTVTLNKGTLTHRPNSAVAAPWDPDARVYIRCTNMTIQAAAKIDTKGRGYAAGCGPGRAGSSSGGGYGGKGGMYNAGAVAANAGKVYGSPEYPDLPGSGGGVGSDAGAGGGAVRLEVSDLLTLNGTISANSLDALLYLYSGGGSGGGITLLCRRVTGTGLITADGMGGTGLLSNWKYYSGSGGGGRIAVHYDPAAQGAQNLTAPPKLRMWANQGLGPIGDLSRGEPGSLYVTDTQIFPEIIRGGAWYGFDALTVPNLVVNNGWAIFPEGVTLNVLTNLTILDTEARLDLQSLLSLTVGDSLSLSNRVPAAYTSYCKMNVFSAQTNESTEVWGTTLTIGKTFTVSSATQVSLYSQPINGGSTLIQARDIEVAANSTLYADAAGFAGGSATNGIGPGGGGMGKVNASTSSGGGGGYGGRGGQYQTRGEGGVAYGLRKTPLHPGSGGGGRLGLATAGGAGGGLIQLHAEDGLTINGTITANGVAAAATTVGGGAGGGIYLTCRALAGAGVLRANGGTAGSTSGAGSGGRIAIWRTVDRPGMAITATAAAGSGSSQNGLEDGTVYWSQPIGTVLFLQ